MKETCLTRTSINFCGKNFNFEQHRQDAPVGETLKRLVYIEDEPEMIDLGAVDSQPAGV